MNALEDLIFVEYLFGIDRSLASARASRRRDTQRAGQVLEVVFFVDSYFESFLRLKSALELVKAIVEASDAHLDFLLR